MRAVRGKGLLAAGLIFTALAASAGSAQGAVTIGSNFTSAPPTANAPGCEADGVTCTATNLSLPPSNVAPGGLFSPVNGTVTSWSIATIDVHEISLQVLRPAGGTTYTGVATSAPVSYMLPLDQPFPQNATNLPIKIGDGIGLRDPHANFIYANTIGGQVAAWYLAPNGPLGDGQTRTADVVGNNEEVLVQATIEPTNTVTAGTIARNKKKGTATVTISVPNAGQLSYTGTGVNVTGPASVAAPGDIEVTVRATGKKRKKLNKKGKVSISFGTTFTPNFGAAGITPTNLTLRKKLKK
jgi:hypothetical protein